MSNVCHGGRTIEMIETAASHTRTERDRKKIMQGIPKETLRRMYVDMVRTRTLDEKIKEMLNRGFSISEHSTLGQEAGPIGACAALAESGQGRCELLVAPPLGPLVLEEKRCSA